MGWKKLIIGEKMPDKNDPAYKEKREQAEKAGKTFAETLRLDKAAAYVQRFASGHNKMFLALVFSFVLFSISLNLYRMFTAVKHRYQPTSAIERQESELHLKRHHQANEQIKDMNTINKQMTEHETDREDKL